MFATVFCTEGYLNRDNVVKSYAFTFLGKKRNFAVVTLPMPIFDPKEMDDFVLLRKKSFSCNFRDQATLRHHLPIWDYRDIDHEEHCASFGSDFCAEVLEVGHAVKNLQKGDMVIPDCSYEFKAGLPDGIPTNRASLEYEIIHHKKLQVINSMDFSIAGGFSVCSQTAFAMARKLSVENDAQILIHGASCTTALTFISAMEALGKTPKLIGLVRNNTWEKHLLRKGFSDVVQVDFADAQMDLHDKIKGYGKFEAVVDFFSSDQSLGLIQHIRPNGTFLTCGVSLIGESKKGSVNEHLQNIIVNNLNISGSCLGSSVDLESAIKAFKSKEFVFPDIQLVKPEALGQFIEASFGKKTSLGKTVLSYF